MRSQPAGSRNTTRRDADLPPRVRSSRAGWRLDRQGWTNGLDRAPHRHPVAALPIEPGAAATTPVLPMTVVDRRRNGRLDVRRLGTQERSVADSAAGEGRDLGAEIEAADQFLDLVADAPGADVAAVRHLLTHQELPVTGEQNAVLGGREACQWPVEGVPGGACQYLTAARTARPSAGRGGGETLPQVAAWTGNNLAARAARWGRCQGNQVPSVWTYQEEDGRGRMPSSRQCQSRWSWEGTRDRGIPGRPVQVN